MASLVFEFETSKAQLMRTQELILDAVDRQGVERVSDDQLPEVEMLDKAQGPYFKYRWRIPLKDQVSDTQITRVLAGVPVGVQLRVDSTQ